jgi:hypothetical protein
VPRLNKSLLAFFFFPLALLAQQQSPSPELPDDIPKDAVVRIMLTGKTPSGQDAVWKSSDGTIHEFFQFNDRGRGPKIYTTYRLDQRGLIVFEESKGVDYMKTPVEERFSMKAGDAEWKNQSENERQSDASGKFFVDLNGGPESGALLARALLSPERAGKLPVLPSGQAAIRKLQSLPLEVSGKKRTATLYEISGLGFTPQYLWLDEEQQFFATVYGWSAVVQRDYEFSVSQLRESQRQAEIAHAGDLAKTLSHRVSSDLVIRNVTLFDSAAGKLLPSQRVTVHGERIASVELDDGRPSPKGSQVIDGGGKMLLPGLWDMHAHLFPEDAFLDIAAGVTTVRDLGNPIDELTKLREQIQNGTQIGPRVVLAGFIDGPGPFEGPVKVLVATPDEARRQVDHYADLGYVQIKIYSSVKPELVPIIAEQAHKRGLRWGRRNPAHEFHLP